MSAPPLWIQQCDDARRGKGELVLLEGVQPLKHALRFGADVLAVCSPEPQKVLALASELAPDVVERLAAILQPVAPEVFSRATLGREPPSPVIALARKRTWNLDEVERSGRAKLVLAGLTHPGNIGACVRIAAAFGWSGVVGVDTPSFWHPLVVRAAAGLQWALPVISLSHAEAERHLAKRPEPRVVLACEEQATPLLPTTALPSGGWYIFGSERHGVPASLANLAALSVRIPMKEGVSSINVAAAAAVVCHHLAAQEGWVTGEA
ncbi:MAG: rRNA methyltransferase [Candidatus Parcubacteria bacterium]|nr:MAG: rRNA methyltransferase [Candidatus Parcubacteria bacterium]